MRVREGPVKGWARLADSNAGERETLSDQGGREECGGGVLMGRRCGNKGRGTPAFPHDIYE